MHSFIQRQKNLRPSFTLKCTFYPSSLLVERPFQWGSFSFCSARLTKLWQLLDFAGLYSFFVSIVGKHRSKWRYAISTRWRANMNTRQLVLLLLNYETSGWHAGVECAWSSSLSQENGVPPVWEFGDSEIFSHLGENLNTAVLLVVLQQRRTSNWT